MGIVFYEKEGVFRLDTKNTTYALGLIDNEKFASHLYYGKKLGQNDSDLQYLARINEFPFVPSVNARDRLSFLDSYPSEYAGHGTGDFRDSAVQIKTRGGHSAVSFTYKTHRIYDGKDPLNSLPSTFPGAGAVQTLELVCEDASAGLEAVLSYSVFDDCDAVIRSVKLKNVSKEKIQIVKCMSLCLDMDNDDYEMISLHGSWARERHIQRRKIGFGSSSVSSLRGESGHQDHPFIALVNTDTTQTRGNVYGFSFVYSGNFYAGVSVNQFNSARILMGINPSDFCWNLQAGEVFTSPEAVLVYSNEGIGGMSRTFHDVFRNHLIRGQYKDKKRPILINNWEATYFDFDTDKLLSIAKDAAKTGIEMLVMDDGWFGNRSSDNMALGDWVVNDQKLKGGLPYLVNEVNKLGLKFGIWFEPEMISPDSDLYRAHPDWAIAIPSRTPGLARNQYVLDYSRRDVVEHVYESLKKILTSANIEYVKWDMNRPLSDIGSAFLDSESQGELYHRYVLGVYAMQERLITDFPHILLENCSGGGARFDPGMLYYSPQIWCSDDTDAVERLMIQEGTAMVYPLSAMGAHVSVCPNHTVGRVTPFETRGYVALAGTFGYELDITKLSEEDKDSIKHQVELYHRYNDLVRTGTYYRLASYGDNHEFDAWQVSSKDGTKALVTYVQVLSRPNQKSRIIKVQGLKENVSYRVTLEGSNSADDMKLYSLRLFSGSMLMNGGLVIRNPWGDFQSKLIYIEAVE